MSKFFKRNTDNIEAIKAAMTTLDEQTAKHVEQLIKDYESITFENWQDKTKFNFDVIDTMINDTCFDEKFIAEQLANNHPTLQQNFMRLCMRFIEKMGEKTYFDGRNEASVKTAKQIVEALGGTTYLPLV